MDATQAFVEAAAPITLGLPDKPAAGAKKPPVRIRKPKA